MCIKLMWAVAAKYGQSLEVIEVLDFFYAMFPADVQLESLYILGNQAGQSGEMETQNVV